MNRQLITRLLIVFITSSSLLGAPLSTHAHDDEPHIELNTTQAQPGTTVEVRGASFEPEDAVTVLLIGAERQLLLGTVTADREGSFTQALSLPADLPPGEYEVRASDSHHSASAPLNIVSAISSEENEQRDESEPLLAPMPTRAPDSVAATPAAAPRAAPQPATAFPFWPLALLGMLVVGAAVVIARRKH